MKVFFATFLIALFLLILILSLDLIMGTTQTTVTNLLWKMKRPFEVPEPAEYFIVFIFGTIIIGKPVIPFLKKRFKKKPSAN